LTHAADVNWPIAVILPAGGRQHHVCVPDAAGRGWPGYKTKTARSAFFAPSGL